jgi:hypothetical protein
MQSRRVFEYECSPTLYTWQEFHDHIFSERVHSFCLELMPDFQPTSKVSQ